MLEARKLVQECVSQGLDSSGFKREFLGLAEGLKVAPDDAYRLYVECLFDEIGREVRVLFDRRDPSGLLWPRRQAPLDLLAILNAPELAYAAYSEASTCIRLPFNRSGGRGWGMGVTNLSGAA